MRIDLDITATLTTGSRTFTLRSQVATTNDRVVLFGPSGSGKTLTLSALAGLLRPDAGRIVVDGRVLYDSAAGVDVPARERGVGYVFQDYALFPHMSVRENVAFGLSYKPQAYAVDELLERFGLSQVASLRPGRISGGQRQRTAMARALAPGPSLLLLDEPFSALDQPLRRRMRDELETVLDDFGVPLVLVTHDVTDVERFARTLVVFREGGVERTFDYSVTPCTAPEIERLFDDIFLLPQT